MQTIELDRVFQALADPTRRAVVERLGRGEAPVSDLAEPFAMALPTFLQHLKVLESSGLVTTEKVGRVRTCKLALKTMRAAETWLTKQRALWETRFDQLDAYLEELEPKRKKEREK